MVRNQTKDYKTLRCYNIVLNNFENYCIEKRNLKTMTNNATRILALLK
jgi:hypothetical protein